MTDIVSDAEFDEYISNEFGTVEASLRSSAVAAGRRAVRAYCARDFTVVAAGAEATARLYVPNGSDVLRIDDCTTVTAITIDGSALAASAYQLEPYRVDRAGLTRPYEQVRYLLGYWYGATPGKASVSVTAKWGWAALPGEVPEAVKQIGRLHLLRRRMGLDDAEYREILASLNDLRAVEAFGVA